MDGTVPDTRFLEERRKRLAAERTLDHTRRELTRAHAALVANADRLSRRYLSEKDQNLRLTDRQRALVEQCKDAADKADRARRRLWHALEAMRDGFALFDSKARLVAANHVWLGLFDAGSEIGPGAHATEIFYLAAEEGAFDIGDLAPEEWADAQLARWDADSIAPQDLHHYDGRILRLQDRRAPDGDVVSLMLDVTEDRAREAALTEARDLAEATARAKADFLARMSHEIRTPMNGVLGMAQMLTDQTEGTDPEAALYAKTIRDSAEALLVIVNDTLDVSKLEAGKVELRSQPLDLEGLLCDCMRLAASRAAEGVQTALSYPMTAPTRFLGDEGRVRQIVMNLLGNALKFTENGHVVLRVTVGDDVVIAVEDTGPGIPADRIDQVFEAFGQVDDPSRPAREGTGLGLTISRGLAQQMGGDLRVDSVFGEGSTFTLTLPLMAQAPAVQPNLPHEIIVPGPGDVPGDLLADQLAATGLRIHRGAIDRTVPALLPLSLPHAAQARAVAELPPDTLLIGLGRRAEAAPDIAARIAAYVPTPATGATLSQAFKDAKLPTPAAPAPPVEPLPRERPRVLLADDNATNRLLLDRLLRDQDFDIQIVDDGQQAVDAYLADRPDAIVLDISMPVLDGFGAAEAIQADAKATGQPVPPLLALTAHVGDDMAERLREAGFVAVLTKPLRKPLLLEALDEAMGQPSRT